MIALAAALMSCFSKASFIGFKHLGSRETNLITPSSSVLLALWASTTEDKANSTFSFASDG